MPAETSKTWRRATRGATLAAHGDRVRTHAISAIVFIAQESGQEPWPLQFVPNGARLSEPAQEVRLDAKHNVLLYESTQPHGRVEPLTDKSYTAAFFHWMPADWNAMIAQVLGQRNANKER